MSSSFKELCSLSVEGNEAKLLQTTLLQSIDFVVWDTGDNLCGEFKEIQTGTSVPSLWGRGSFQPPCWADLGTIH